MENSSNAYDIILSAMQLAENIVSKQTFIDVSDYLKQWKIVFDEIVKQSFESMRSHN